MAQDEVMSGRNDEGQTGMRTKWFKDKMTKDEVIRGLNGKWTKWLKA